MLLVLGQNDARASKFGLLLAATFFAYFIESFETIMAIDWETKMQK